MHRCPPLRAVSVPLLIAAVIVGGSPAHGQAPRKSRSRAQNVQAGSIASIDVAAGTVALKPRTGADILYHLTDKTRIHKDKKAVDASAFKPGEAAVVRFRKSAAGPASLYDLADKPSWDWLDRLRHETTAVTVVEVTDDYLKAAEGKDKAEIDYRITEKTAWQKSGKAAAASDFKAGDSVYVVPRMLPGGNIMATAVSDAAGDAAVLKERAKSTVSGTVKSLDMPARILHLHTTAGENREIGLAPDVVVRQAAKDVPVTALRAGLMVTAHLSRSAENEMVGTRITIQSRKSPSKRAPGAKPLIRAPVKP